MVTFGRFDRGALVPLRRERAGRRNRPHRLGDCPTDIPLANAAIWIPDPIRSVDQESMTVCRCSSPTEFLAVAPS